LDGYDDSVIIPEEVTNLFDGKRVTTFEKMRETIYTIRKAYFDYYESRAGKRLGAAPRVGGAARFCLRAPVPGSVCRFFLKKLYK